MQPAVSSAQVFKFGLFEADVARNTLTRNGVRIKIQDQPFRVLLLLLERPSEIITREELRQKLWPEGTYVDFDGSLNVILKKLRAAIDDDSDNPRFIETVPRRGYRFIAPVSANGAKPEPITASIAVAQMPSIAPDSAVPLPNAVRKRPSYLIYICSAVALFFVMGATFSEWRQKQSTAKENTLSLQSTARVPLRESVAILGFHNVSGRVNDAWLATAFSEMLSTELSGGEKLRLVSGEDVAHLRLISPWSQTDTLDQETTARVGTALNSDLLVLGSYTTIGKPDRGQLRLDVRLQDAKSGEILTEIAEIGGTQDLFHIVSRVGAKLRDRLGVPRLEQPDEASVLAALPSDPVAARFYALGIARLRAFDASAAKDLLQQATNVEPKFSLAHAMLARAWSQLGYDQKRKEETRKALDLSAGLPRADQMLVEGDYYESVANHEKAASIYHALFALFPDNIEYGLQLAKAQQFAGHGSEGLGTLAQLRRLPPPASDDPGIDLAQARIVEDKATALTLVREALRKASAQGKKLVYAQARHDECITIVYSDHPEEGTASCEDAYNTFLAAGNRLAAADSLRLIGDRQGAQGHYDEAIATYQRVLTNLRELGDHEKIGAVLNNMGTALMNHGNLDRAERLFEQSKSHFEQAGDKRNVATAVSNIADVLYLRGQLSKAAQVYQQDLEIVAALDLVGPGYPLYRLADLELTQGRPKEARHHVEKAIEVLHDGGEELSNAMIVLGELQKAEGDLKGARQQYEQSLATRQTMRDMNLVAESQVELADLSVEEGHPEAAENQLRQAIPQFEKENLGPDATSAYTVLSRVLLTEGKIEEARKAIERAAEFDRSTPDPSLSLPIAIQRARIEMAAAGHSVANAVTAAHQQLRSAMTTAKQLGYYNLECEARLTLSELALKANPASGRAQLAALATETRSRGLELLAHHAEQAIAAPGTVVAANTPDR